MPTQPVSSSYSRRQWLLVRKENDSRAAAGCHKNTAHVAVLWIETWRISQKHASLISTSKLQKAKSKTTIPAHPNKKTPVNLPNQPHHPNQPQGGHFSHGLMSIFCCTDWSIDHPSTQSLISSTWRKIHPMVTPVIPSLHPLASLQ